VNVSRLGADVLVFPARKWLRGPKGISVLYLSDRALGMLGAPPTLDIASAVWDGDTTCRPRDDARRFEVYEYHPGLRLALRAAADYAMQVGIDRIAARNREVLHLLRTRIEHELDMQAVAGKDAAAFLTYRVSAGKADALMKSLEENGINASLVGKQYARWAMTARGMDKLLRLTPHYITEESEMASLMTVLKAHRALLA
jgi:selenocysteine lyase/cysteine desulfurase